jgi:hypothetical protein
MTSPLPWGEAVPLRRFHQPERDGQGVTCAARSDRQVTTKTPKHQAIIGQFALSVAL